MINYSGCQNNWYGDKCASPCGHCKNSETCSQTTGICPHGCIDGYFGEKCDTGMQTFVIMFRGILRYRAFFYCKCKTKLKYVELKIIQTESRML